MARYLPLLGFVIFGVVSRLLPHPPNFTPINAMALFSAFYLGGRTVSFATVFFTMLLSDLILGYHATLPFVYASFGLVILAAHKIKGKISFSHLPLVSFGASLFFFLVTNFGSWMTSGLYPATCSGLGLCYLAALPFFVNQIWGDFMYVTLLFVYMSLLKNFFHRLKITG